MNILLKRSLLLVSGLFFLFVFTEAQVKVKIACVGNSITAGARLANPAVEAWPAQLQIILGDKYEVLNFGVSGTTVLRNCEKAYVKTDKYKDALKSNADIFFIKLGTNDSRLPYRLQIDSFIPNYKTLIYSLRSLPSHPRIILLLPVTSYLTDTMRQTDEAISKFILPRIRQIAYEEKLQIIDLHSFTMNSAALFPDQLHPSAEGAALMARRLSLLFDEQKHPSMDIFKSISVPYQVSSFYGYDCADFNFEGHPAKVVKPRVIAEGKPWVWRARFWGHEPQTDIALLDRGFHIVYCDVAELFGNQEAIYIWNKFYAWMQVAGMAPKAVMEGLSRGGVYVYRWAAVNPDKIACIYADAPVLDLKSWPGGKGKGPGSPADWEIFKKDFNLKSEEEALEFKGNPLDLVPEIVKGHYPMLHVVGDADDIVPVAENTSLFEEKVKSAGDQITVIHKPGIGHHPHSLPNPQPIVDFIMNSVKSIN